MGGTDFSTRPYTLDDMVDHLGGTDLNLTAFALQPEDFKLKVNNEIFSFFFYFFWSSLLIALVYPTFNMTRWDER